MKIFGGLLVILLVWLGYLLVTDRAPKKAPEQVKFTTSEAATTPPTGKPCVPTADSMETTYRVFRSKHPGAVCDKFPDYGNGSVTIRTSCTLHKSVRVAEVTSSTTKYNFDGNGRLIDISSWFDHDSKVGFDKVRRALTAQCGTPKKTSTNPDTTDYANANVHAHDEVFWEGAGYRTVLENYQAGDCFSSSISFTAAFE